MIGSTLGSYRIVAQLGQGGMGTVYQAEDTRLGRISTSFDFDAFSMLEYLLARFYRGQIYERTGRASQAVGEYRYFLSSFDRSNAKLPQIAEAREAVRRLA